MIKMIDIDERRRRGSGNSQAKGPDLDDAPKSTALCRVPKVQLLIANGHKEESLRLYTEAQISHQSGRFVPFCVQKTMRVAE